MRATAGPAKAAVRLLAGEALEPPAAGEQVAKLGAKAAAPRAARARVAQP